LNLLLISLAVLAIILLIVGGAIAAVKFLLWVGLVLLIIAAIAFLVRVLTGRRV
jgi:membrane protein implicated in regulation of membrane protease activity